MQPYFLQTFHARRDNPRGASGEFVFESFADLCVQVEQIVLHESFSVWRIGYDEAWFGLCVPVGYAAPVEGDVFAQSGGFHVGFGYFERSWRDVASDDFVCKFALFAVVVVDGVEKCCVEIRPLFESKRCAIDAWRNVQCYQCGFDEQRARTAHRVNKIGLSVPTGYE